MFNLLKKINQRPRPFEFYTAPDLWADKHTSGQMLAYHLNETIDVSSRNQKFIRRSIEWITSRFNVGSDTKIADFGCGPGLYALPLAESGAVVTGIDFSKNSIQYAQQAAREKGVSVQYRIDNYLEFETNDRFDLILMIMCDFCALSPAQRTHLLSKFASLLTPDGSVLLDVYSVNRMGKLQETAVYELNHLDNFWSAEDSFCFINTFKYEDEKVSLDKYTIVEPSRTRFIYNWLQHYSLSSIEQEFEKAGLRIVDFHADVAGAPFSRESDEFAVVAQKNGSSLISKKGP